MWLGLQQEYLVYDSIYWSYNFAKEGFIIPTIRRLDIFSSHNADISSQQAMEFVCHLMTA